MEEPKFTSHEFFRNAIPGYVSLLMVASMIFLKPDLVPKNILDFFKSSPALGSALILFGGYPIGVISYNFFDFIYTDIFQGRDKRGHVSAIKKIASTTLKNNLTPIECRAIWDSWLFRKENEPTRERITILSTRALGCGTIFLLSILFSIAALPLFFSITEIGVVAFLGIYLFVIASMLYLTFSAVNYVLSRFNLLVIGRMYSFIKPLLRIVTISVTVVLLLIAYLKGQPPHLLIIAYFLVAASNYSLYRYNLQVIDEFEMKQIFFNKNEFTDFINNKKQNPRRQKK